jgi:hypothetical protein
MSWFAQNGFTPQVEPTRAQNTGIVPPQTPPAPNGDAGYYTDFGGGNVAQQQQQIADAARAGAPLGFDAKKWADPTQGVSNKYTAGRTLQAGGSINDVLQNPQFKGWTPVSNDKIKSPDGNIYDLKFDVGGKNERTQYTLVGGPKWDAEQNNGYQGNIGGATGRGTPQGDAKYAAYLAAGGAPIPGPQPGGASGAGGSTADFQVKPWDQRFQAPTDVTEQNDPGFQFRLKEDQQALERSAAARGTLLTTGTLKDLGQRQQDIGAQEFQNVYNRALGKYQNDFGAHQANEQARYAAHNANFGNNLNLNQNQFNQGLATNQNAFNQQYSLANLGYNAALGQNASSTNNANNAGNLLTGQGNVNAAGQVGAANAWNGAIGSLANIGQYYAGLYGGNRNPTREQTWTY